MSRAREAPTTFCGLPTLRPDAQARTRAATPETRGDARDDANRTRVRKLLLVRHGAKAKTTRGKRDAAEIRRACEAANVDVETATTERAGRFARRCRDGSSARRAGGATGGERRFSRFRAARGIITREISGCSPSRTRWRS